MYGMLECQLCCELLLLLNVTHMDVEGCGVSSAEYSVHLVGVNRLIRDGVKLLWCHSHLVWLVL